ncbi:PBP1A family penicillin-binding protein [Sporolactobacillus shoreicorticis]|uniref:Transglycosylase domain-containing protein n=1 Tax=Sporolactobacillus shoreicorticis TaxID=1923877 RepID=A0ABW5S658_9BACL|nr:PBP1A family penicillin-binding protein [Sporolactobacillus shoreicorticis]MCO7126730.1 PBP1A family penicillin-binding protein [Sporolactobacillus shoreicorticis]
MSREKLYTRLFQAAYFIIGAAIVGLLFYFFVLLLGNHYTDDEKLVMSRTSVVVDEQGHELSRLYAENRDPVALKKVPKQVQNAFIVTEDLRFYKHSGIDLRGIMRALVTDIMAGDKAEGASTITQQLARNAYLSNEKTWFRKFKEAAIAVSLERKYSKKQILEMYLNQVYFGHGIYGIQMASEFFFNKDVGQLTEEEAALLAALPKGPNGYSPILHPKKALLRRNLVLSLLEKNGYLTAEQSVRLKGKTLGLNVHKIQTHPEFDSYMDLVKEEAAKKYHIGVDDLIRGGYKIVVPMSREAQSSSYNAFKNNIYFQGSNPNQTPQGSFILMNKNGGVLAVQGGRNYVRGSYNRVNVKRQPGSAFKPLAVYGPALDSGKYQPYSMLQDKKVAYGKYQPTNYSGRYSGEMTMYDAITVSQNAPAVWLLNQIGISKSKSYLSKMGINLSDNGLAIALGGLSKGVSPLQMASAYTAFDNGGSQSEPYFIQAIYDHQGKKIGGAKPTTKKIFSEQTAWYMTRMLQSVMKNGTGRAGYSQAEIAGKTGSTAYTKNGLRDLWFVGYTPDVVGAVWIGYDKTIKDQYLTGSSNDAVRLYQSVINSMPKERKLAFEKPENVTDLDHPIRLTAVTQLSAKGVLGKYALPALQLSWNGSSDKRMIYRIYVEVDGKKTLKGEVKGKNTYRIDFVNPMSKENYYVVPYNSQTGKTGTASPSVELNWFSKI